VNPAGPAASGPRRLLARLRDVMAGPGTAQQRLDKVAQIIAADMVAEVCSVYVQRAGEVLELFATEGLKAAAVHLTRLRVGEGLVGLIAAHAAPLAIADAQHHPNFAYRPETGEEIYHSLMGVPILHSGRVIGVLVVQNRTQRHYTEEEVETLQTVAMVLAELIMGGELIDREELRPVDGIALLPLRTEGLRLNPGLGMGVAVLHQPQIDVHRMVAENPESELDRLRVAVNEMHGALDVMLEATHGEHRDILETYRMIAEDAGWIGRIEEAIDSGLTAEAAVQKVQNDLRARLIQATDPYLRERVHDLDDLANRLLQHLIGTSGPVQGELPERTILVARSMGPAELLDYDPARLKGLVLEEGSPTSHVAIVARALDIPVIGRVKDALTKIEPGDTVIVDADNAQVLIRPGDDVQQLFAENLRARSQQRAAFASLRHLPAVSRDGERVMLYVNAGLLADLQQVEETGADGIGLYRTEVAFMTRPQFPDVEAQTALYARIIDHCGAKPVVFRTLDVGGDKILPYFSRAEEENPAMGWRAIRLTLDRPAVLRQQLRALVRAAAGRELNVMFPMIAEVAEFDAARALLDKEIDRARKRGPGTPERLRVGAMFEVPALAYQLPSLLKRVDFLSVGSNDLFQFMFAADRGNPRLSERYDLLSPGALRFLRGLVEQCRMAGVQLSLCGEMGGRPIEAMALVGLGFRHISMAAPAIGPVKAMVRSLGVGALETYMARFYDSPDHSLREKLRAFALDHGVIIYESHDSGLKIRSILSE
jgi:phosphotransferase system enzyme I (PtsP)